MIKLVCFLSIFINFLQFNQLIHANHYFLEVPYEFLHTFQAVKIIDSEVAHSEF